ncbi:hypothetical protein BDP27DRAFT_65468 [Rhodocollybia butyracea]|uniref:Uncharacterized protein n=1 Tax=Rhodocollybia butyracea TaxID=206335 RepID=A0A9P5U4Z3_9AGAR|nr:hypothetical protein BDP27DRAFT_65468 [Rhodocollybia butyracea]
MTLDVHIIDLPEDRPVEPSLDSAISFWGLEEHQDDIQNVRDTIARSTGHVHCEAGLLASLVYPTAPKNQEEFDFRSIPKGTEHVIGVAKKCCPVCRHLVTVLETRKAVKLHLPGNHSRYHLVLGHVKQMLEEKQGSCSGASSVTSDDLAGDAPGVPSKRSYTRFTSAVARRLAFAGDPTKG